MIPLAAYLIDPAVKYPPVSRIPDWLKAPVLNLSQTRIFDPSILSCHISLLLKGHYSTARVELQLGVF